MKNNSYRKLFWADKFGWRYYCSRAARGQRKYDKAKTSKMSRKNDKSIINNGINEYESEEQNND